MNVYIDGLNKSKLNSENIKIMIYLNNYLENKWNIKKKGDKYILKKDGTKIYILSNYANYKKKEDVNVSEKNEYIYNFLFNTLDNGWTIKKNINKYTFIKNHQGKKEIFMDNYITTFMKDNFKI